MMNDQKMIRFKERTDRGFTLVEIVVVIVLMGILGVFTVQFISQAARANQLTADQKDIVDEAKLAMEFLTRELRMADTTTNAIVQTATSVLFDKLSAYEQDTNISQIQYSYNSGTQTLSRTSNAVTTTVATKITAFDITKTTNGDGKDFYVITMTLTGAEGGTFKLISGVVPRIGI
ncbi:hypothetical protein UZ36_05985 [Candidatus Nitromaritima sp. SCGC AAA799-C22]|nr:hypothetical protein UZ36_05985 [Candidatus Nitromaritima sp. SCGC AAA799-C22]